MCLNCSCFSLNVRGIRDLTKRKALFLFCNSNRRDVYFLQETHSSVNDESFWSSQWGGKVLFSHGSTHSGGVMILFNYNFNGKILESHFSLEGRWIIAIVQSREAVFILCNIYGFNNSKSNEALFQTLSNKLASLKLKFPSAAVIMGGDFNEAPDLHLDRFPPRLNVNNFNLLINDLCSSLDLLDAYRHVHGNNISSFTWFKADLSQKSRIDLWLISDWLIPFINSCTISHAPLTDHAYIDLEISENQNSSKRHPGYWKLNTTFLQNPLYCSGIKDIIETFKGNTGSATANWELFKYECRRFSIRFGKRFSKEKELRSSAIIKDINNILCLSSPSDQDKEKLYLLKEDLDALYAEKAKGAFVRSRAKWLEFGERNSTYFFNLEKRRGELKKISTLDINGVLISDEAKISKFVADFYQQLYTSYFHSDSSKQFFSKVEQFIPNISEDSYTACEGEITVEEMDILITKTPHNKSPGPDGLPFEFYRSFWNDIKYFILDVFKECLDRGELAESMKQGIITLIPKSNKDKKFLDNWRPITLLNSDYKLLAALYARRLKPCLEEVISITQSGFMRGRHISNNIRLVLDLLDYSELVNDDALILFLDFYKAFDTVEHAFMYEALRHFGFGPNFMKTVQTLYKNITSNVSLSSGTSPRFVIGRGIRQGCPISPFLFLLVAELLNLYTINCLNIEGIKIADRSILISQLADDTCLFLKDKGQVPTILQALKLFSLASGLSVNQSKSEIMTVHHSDMSDVCGIKVKQTVRYLGITITKCPVERIDSNFSKCLLNAKTVFNCWSQRNLSIYGRVLLSKAEGISRLVYPALSLYVNPKMCSDIDRALFKFIWKNKTEYVKRKTIIRPFSEGGLNVLDFSTLNIIFKINWIKHCLSQSNSIWFYIPNLFFEQCGGLSFLLSCDFKYSKLPIKLSNFHKQSLEAWKLAFKHNFSPHSCILWNNQFVLSRNKSIFKKEWFDKGIIFLSDLLNANGEVYTFQEFFAFSGIRTTCREYNLLVKSISPKLLYLLRIHLGYNSADRQIPKLIIGGINIMDFKCNNSHIREYLIRGVSCYPIALRKWKQFFSIPSIEKIWSASNKYLLPNKVKEVHFKILHRYYPCNTFINKFKKDVSPKCSFCNLEDETLTHLFCKCIYSEGFWKRISNLIFDVFYKIVKIEESMIFFLNCKTGSEEVNNALEVLILFGKFHIHKTKIMSITPSFNFFCKDLNIFFESLTSITSNKKCIKTSRMLKNVMCKL